MSYFGYKRGDKPRVNWGGLAEKFSQDLLAEKASRDQRKKSIADAQAKELAELDKQAVTPETSVNGEIIRSSNDARQAYLTNVRLMRRGLIKPSTARAGQQRLADGYKMYNQYMTTWGEEYQKFVTDRTGTGSALDDFIQQDRFKFGNLEQWGLVVDPNNMNLLMGSKDKDGNIDMSKTVDMANIVNTNQDFHDEFDATEFNKNLGTEITGIIESSEVVEILGGEANVLQVYEDYYAMGDPSKFIDAVESEDFTKVQEMNADAASDGALTNYGQAYYNIFKTINSALGAVNVRDRASALEQIGYELVDVSDDVDLETLQSDAKYNKEGSKEIYVYRDEQNLLQPYLSESQNRDFERDGLDRALAAKDFKISKQRIIRDRSDSGGGGGGNAQFNSSNFLNIAQLYRPIDDGIYNSAAGNVAGDVGVNAGEIQLTGGNTITGFSNNVSISGVDLTNEEYRALSRDDKKSILGRIKTGSPDGYISTAQANWPGNEDEWDILLADFDRELGRTINLSNSTLGITYKLSEAEAFNFQTYSSSYFSSEYGMSDEATKLYNAKEAGNSNYGVLLSNINTKLEKMAEDAEDISRNGSLSASQRNAAEQLANEIGSLTVKDAGGFKINVSGKIGNTMVQSFVSADGESLDELWGALERAFKDIENK
jgi:hypothetical protein